MMQLPAIRPAEGHLASVLSKHLSVGSDFGISPEITANLVEMIETGLEDLPYITAPGLRMTAGRPRQSGVCVYQQIETRIEQVKGQPAGRLPMAANGLQRLLLLIDRQKMLKGAERNEAEAKKPT